MVYVVILNWNGWKDTITCLESLTGAAARAEIKIVLCDNASTDYSVERLKGYLSESSIYRGAWFESNWDQTAPPSARLYLVHNGGNHGYAGGNNRGIRFVRRSFADHDAFWILNNDTAVDVDTLPALRHAASLHGKDRILGSVLVDFSQPDRVQMAGGDVVMPLGFPRKRHKRKRTQALPSYVECDYVSGASLFITSSLIERIGLMDEHYFLYWEETDWCFRATRITGHRALCVTSSRVLHQEGASVGFRSELQRKLDAINKMKFLRRYSPVSVPTAALAHILINAVSDVKAGRLTLRHVGIDLRFLLLGLQTPLEAPSHVLAQQ